MLLGVPSARGSTITIGNGRKWRFSSSMREDLVNGKTMAMVKETHIVDLLRISS